MRATSRPDRSSGVLSHDWFDVTVLELNARKPNWSTRNSVMATGTNQGFENSGLRESTLPSCALVLPAENTIRLSVNVHVERRVERRRTVRAKSRPDRSSGVLSHDWFDVLMRSSEACHHSRSCPGSPQ